MYSLGIWEFFHFPCIVAVEDCNHLADFVKTFNCEQKIMKYAILKVFRVAKFKLINFVSNSNACSLFRNGSVPGLFVLTYGISHWS